MTQRPGFGDPRGDPWDPLGDPLGWVRAVHSIAVFETAGKNRESTVLGGEGGPDFLRFVGTKLNITPAKHPNSEGKVIHCGPLLVEDSREDSGWIRCWVQCWIQH